MFQFLKLSSSVNYLESANSTFAKAWSFSKLGVTKSRTMRKAFDFSNKSILFFFSQPRWPRASASLVSS